ncbi:MAG: chemotaxis protein CheW, partial [Planctomycetia bacterium]
KSYRRMIVIERGGDRWVFDADEIEGVRRFPYDQIKPSPVTITKTADTYTRGVVTWRERDVGCLDGRLLFDALARQVR